jgi:hypothetical protein
MHLPFCHLNFFCFQGGIAVSDGQEVKTGRAAGTLSPDGDRHQFRRAQRFWSS